jgi:hypothetical protein
MSVASAVARGQHAWQSAAAASSTQVADVPTRVAWAWIVALVFAAPFELRHPLIAVPGQSLTSVEVVLVGGLAIWIAVSLRARGLALPLPAADLLPWAVFVAAACAAGAAAPSFRTNALHMSLRFGLAAIVWTATVSGASAPAARVRIVKAIVASGTAVALLVVADFAKAPGVFGALSAFRESVAIVGAQVRASGPFQYPTIASMFLEIAFALGLGLLASARNVRNRFLMIALLALIAEAIVLTFTRSGLITVGLSICLVGAAAWRRSGRRDTTAALVVLTVVIAGELFTSRSAESLMLRLTTEGQGRWFSALIEPPSHVALDTREVIDVPVTITNTGRATWDSNASEPIRLSYHWIDRDSDAVIAWEGERTPFASPVQPGETISIVAQVGSTGRPGEFRLMWDIEQGGRLWFSTEPDSIIVLTPGTITGPVTGAVSHSGPRRIPRAATRPGRLVLWRAAWGMFRDRPWLGVGPDNYRLLYGKYAGISAADPRVHSNNMYVEIAAGMGLIGILAAGWLALRRAADAIATARAGAIEVGVAAACAAIAVHGLADSFVSFTGTYILMAVTLGLASAYARDGGRHAHRV